MTMPPPRLLASGAHQAPVPAHQRAHRARVVRWSLANGKAIHRVAPAALVGARATRSRFPRIPSRGDPGGPLGVDRNGRRCIAVGGRGGSGAQPRGPACRRRDSGRRHAADLPALPVGPPAAGPGLGPGRRAAGGHGVRRHTGPVADHLSMRRREPAPVLPLAQRLEPATTVLQGLPTCRAGTSVRSHSDKIAPTANSSQSCRSKQPQQFIQAVHRPAGAGAAVAGVGDQFHPLAGVTAGPHLPGHRTILLGHPWRRVTSVRPGPCRDRVGNGREVGRGQDLAQGDLAVVGHHLFAEPHARSRDTGWAGVHPPRLVPAIGATAANSSGRAHAMA